MVLIHSFDENIDNECRIITFSNLKIVVFIEIIRRVMLAKDFHLVKFECKCSQKRGKLEKYIDERV